METIKLHDTGAAVSDIQERLARLGFFADDAPRGTFDEYTASAVERFCESLSLPPQREVDSTVWARLVDESFEFGDRTLYLRVPFFHGADVKVLQTALSALGFSCGDNDGIFGPHTERALRSFQLNLGLPSDGIAGGFTFRAINNLSHSWKGKSKATFAPHVGFARAAEVLERHTICLFGVSEFTRDVAARMSNLALATNPASQVVSADSLLVEPDSDMLFIQIMLEGDAFSPHIPVVEFDPTETLALRLYQSMEAAEDGADRIAIRLSNSHWEDAGEVRSAQHYAIELLDAICAALLMGE